MRKLIEEYEDQDLKVNIEITKYLCIGGTSSDLNLENNFKISQCQKYIYLGVIFDTTETDNKEIEKRIIQAKKSIALNGILQNKNITKKWKYNIYKTIKNSLFYGAETWQLTEKYKRKLEIVEMDQKIGKNFMKRQNKK